MESKKKPVFDKRIFWDVSIILVVLDLFNTESLIKK